MPTFQKIEVTIENSHGETENVTTDVDFEVYCAICGAGICNNANTRASRHRSYPQVTIDPCGKCYRDAVEEGEEKMREKMQAEIDDLQTQLAEANKE